MTAAATDQIVAQVLLALFAVYATYKCARRRRSTAAPAWWWLCVPEPCCGTCLAHACTRPGWCATLTYGACRCIRLFGYFIVAALVAALVQSALAPIDAKAELTAALAGAVLPTSD